MIDIAKAKPVDPSIVDIAMNLSSGPHLILRFIHTNKCLSGPVRNLVKALNSIPPILYFCLYDATILLSELVGKVKWKLRSTRQGTGTLSCASFEIFALQRKSGEVCNARRGIFVIIRI